MMHLGRKLSISVSSLAQKGKQMADSTRQDGWWYPYIFVAGFGVVILVNGTLAYFASTSFSGLVSSQAYEEGLAYNTALAMDREQKALGWMVTPQVSVLAKTGETALVEIAVDYRDQTGAGVGGMEVVGTLTRPIGAGDDQSLTFAPLADGRYLTRLEVPQLGAWHLNVTGHGPNGRYQFSQRLVVGAEVSQRQWDGWCKQQCLVVN